MADTSDNDLIQRLRDGDPAAPSEFCERYLPALMENRVWARGSVRDEHILEEAAIQAVLDFVEHPNKYQPARLTVLKYLRMAAAGDLKNLLAKERRHALRRAPLEAVELHPPAGNERQEGAHLPAGVSQELLFRRLREQTPDPRDWQAMQMMIDGVRATADYARIYGLTDLPVVEQRRQVKRHKDRLEKVMKRLGGRLRDGG